jgi:hypothetical protein
LGEKNKQLQEYAHIIIDTTHKSLATNRLRETTPFLVLKPIANKSLAAMFVVVEYQRPFPVPVVIGPGTRVTLSRRRYTLFSETMTESILK